MASRPCLDLALNSAKVTVSLFMGGPTVGLGWISSALAMVGEAVESASGIPMSQPWASGTAIPKSLQDALLTKGNIATHLLSQFHHTHCQRVAIDHWMAAA